MTARLATLVLLGLVVTSCVSTDKDYWWNPGMTAQSFSRDDDQCHQMTTVRSPGAMVAGARIRPSAEVDENAYAVCMEGYGYEKVPKDFVPPR